MHSETHTYTHKTNKHHTQRTPQDPTSTRADTDELTQRQFDALASLLADDYPVVRLVGVEGVCRVAGVYVDFFYINLSCVGYPFIVTETYSDSKAETYKYHDTGIGR